MSTSASRFVLSCELIASHAAATQRITPGTGTGSLGKDVGTPPRIVILRPQHTGRPLRREVLRAVTKLTAAGVDLTENGLDFASIGAAT